MLNLSKIVDLGKDKFQILKEILQRPPAQATCATCTTRSYTKLGRSYNYNLISNE